MYEVGTKYKPVSTSEYLRGLRLILPQIYEIIHYVSFHLLPFTEKRIKDTSCEVNHIRRDGKHAVACAAEYKRMVKNILEVQIQQQTEVQTL